MRRAALALLLVALLAVAGAVPALGSPQPRPVCGPCGSGLTQFADDPAVRELHPTSSTAVVRIHANGSATWHVTTRIANETAAAYLEERPAVLDRAVREALQYDTIDTEYRNITTDVEGRTITAAYVDPDAAYRMPGGVLFNEYFHSRGYDDRAVVTADRLTVVGPSGTTVTNDPAGATVDGRNATWHGDGDDRVSGAPGVEADAYIAYGDGGAASQAWTQIDRGLATVPIVLDVMLPIHVPPLVLFGLLLAGAMAIVPRALKNTDIEAAPVAAAVAGVGAILAVAAAIGWSLPTIVGIRWGLGVGAVYLVLGTVTYWRGENTRPRDLLVAGGLALLVGVAAEAFLAPGDVQPFRPSAMEVASLLPLVLAPAVGAAVNNASRRRAATAWLAMVGAFFAFELALVSPTQRHWGLVLIVLLLSVGVVLIGSLPLIALGSASTRHVTGPD